MGDDDVFGWTTDSGGDRRGRSSSLLYPGAVVERHLEIGLDVLGCGQSQQLVDGQTRCTAAGEVKLRSPAREGEPTLELRAGHLADTDEGASPGRAAGAETCGPAKFTLADHMRRHEREEPQRPNDSLNF